LKPEGSFGPDGCFSKSLRSRTATHWIQISVTTRTTKSTVTFQAPFFMPGLSGEQAAGTYDIEIDEELIEGIERTAYRRVATLMYVTTRASTRTCAITAGDLAAALERDRLALQQD